MPRLTTKIPKYRLHKGSGQAVVTIDGRDVYLGKHGSPESKAKYNQVVAEWQLNGRALPAAHSREVTVNEVILAYLNHVKHYYVKDGRPTSSQHEIRASLQPFHELYGANSVSEIGPLALKTLREHLITRGSWTRPTINRGIGMIKRMFKWAAENELVSAEVYHRLQTVSGLRKGRSEARESEPVKPVSEEHIEAVNPYVSRQIWAMIQLQLLTGMRPGEVVAMRTRDIDTSGKIWIYTPESHKTEHHGKHRAIHLGPKSQTVLQPFLKHELDAFIFSPADAEQERQAQRHNNRQTPLSCGNKPGSNRKKKQPKRKPQTHYTVASYRRAIERACEHAFPPPNHLQPRILRSGKRESKKAFHARLTPEEKKKITDWKREHRWHPNQLRHTAATRLRKEFGIEAARVILGHSSATITEVYAELDHAKAASIMESVG